jgi:hypothetical protein
MDMTAAKIRAKLADGLLPTDLPTTSWGGQGSGKPCDGCGELIQSTELEHELVFDDRPSLRFHVACDLIWQSLRSQMRKEAPEARVS